MPTFKSLRVLTETDCDGWALSPGPMDAEPQYFGLPEDASAAAKAVPYVRSPHACSCGRAASQMQRLHIYDSDLDPKRQLATWWPVMGCSTCRSLLSPPAGESMHFIVNLNTKDAVILANLKRGDLLHLYVLWGRTAFVYGFGTARFRSVNDDGIRISVQKTDGSLADVEHRWKEILQLWAIPFVSDP